MTPSELTRCGVCSRASTCATKIACAEPSRVSYASSRPSGEKRGLASLRSGVRLTLRGASSRATAPSTSRAGATNASGAGSPGVELAPPPRHASAAIASTLQTCGPRRRDGALTRSLPRLAAHFGVELLCALAGLLYLGIALQRGGEEVEVVLPAPRGLLQQRVRRLRVVEAVR